MATQPFKVSFETLRRRLDEFACTVASSLPQAPEGTYEHYRAFYTGYEALKHATSGFASLDAAVVLDTVLKTPIALIVLRTMLGFTPPEWAYVATQRTGVEVSQGAARILDRKVRDTAFKPFGKGAVTQQRVKALVDAACLMLNDGAPPTPTGKIHRLDKADTRAGLTDLRSIAQLGVPYPMLLYERFLGRPFAGHKDSVSELVGDSLEVRIEEALTAAGISYRKTKRAEKIPGFDQAPDFIIPDEFNPQILIEAKIAEDDGTARDKVTRVQHLGHLSTLGQPAGSRKFEVVACIGGRGFGIRREDMKKLLLATLGKVFTLKTLGRLIQCTRLKQFATTTTSPPT